MPFDPSAVKAVTFDAAHTLFHPHPSVGEIYREVMGNHGLDYAATDLEAGFRRAFSQVGKDTAILDGEQRERSYWEAVVKESIRDLSPRPTDFPTLFEDLWHTFAEGKRWRPADKALETLETLRRREFTIALLTNWDARVHQVLRETGFAQVFDRVFVSSEIGSEKPDPPIFLHAARELGRQPTEILHVGDSLQHDVAGAIAAGWQVLRMHTEKGSAEDSYESIGSFEELGALLR